jgi:hypothetical protein
LHPVFGSGGSETVKEVETEIDLVAAKV